MIYLLQVSMNRLTRTAIKQKHGSCECIVKMHDPCNKEKFARFNVFMCIIIMANTLFKLLATVEKKGKNSSEYMNVALKNEIFSIKLMKVIRAIIIEKQKM